MVTVELAGGPCDGQSIVMNCDSEQAPFWIEQQWVDGRSPPLSRPDAKVSPPLFKVVRYCNTGRVTRSGALVYRLEGGL